MKNKFIIFLLAAFCIWSPGLTGCKTFPYSFSEKGANTLDPNIKTVNIHLVENQGAPYVNPQLIPNLTDRLKQRITRQTKLTQTNNENADLDIRSFIRDYSVSTSGVSSANGQT